MKMAVLFFVTIGISAPCAADKVLRAKLISYQKGAATLLDVLTAQKADNDVHLAYISALTERAKGLVALEQAAAVWDLDGGRE